MNIEKRLTKTPKLYFYDTGILRSFINNFETTNGYIYENFIISELQKLFSYHSLTDQLFFFRAHSGMEIDCIIETNDIILAIEVKLSNNVTKSSIKHIKTLQKLSEKKTIGILIYPGNKIEQLYDNIYCIPDFIILN